MKSKILFSCQNCAYQSPKWLGKCPDCGQWNSFAEEKIQKTNVADRYQENQFFTLSTEATSLNEISTQSVERFSSGNSELDRLLGGGLVPGSLVLLGGDPGVGKSTLVLQMMANVAKNTKVLYVSGEESASQIKMRANRLGLNSDHLYVISENNLSKAIEAVQKIKPQLFVLDSIQTMFLPDFESAPGSLTQVRECTGKMLYLSKSLGICTWLIGHMTKEGMIAGPKVLEHMVDTVLYFEGEKGQAFRLLRTSKNRFGSTNEVGVFEMQAGGLMPVENPSQLFLSQSTEAHPGSVIVSSMEGTRPFLVEVQALVSSSYLNMPRRVSIGLDPNRLSLLVAILEKIVGLSFSGQDIFLNVVGGLKLSETSADLGVLMALASSHRGICLPKGLVFLGELGLSGELRAVNQLELRIQEIERLGFQEIISSEQSLKLKSPSKLKIKAVKNVQECFNLFF